MIRFVYIWLLRLHPRQFRQRFCAEMLWIFDESTGGRRRLVADAIASLVRQWACRSEFRTPAAPVAGAALDDVPIFYMGESSTPRLGALINGAILSLAVFGVLSFVASHGGGHRRSSVWPLGAHDLGPFTLRSSHTARAENLVSLASAASLHPAGRRGDWLMRDAPLLLEQRVFGGGAGGTLGKTMQPILLAQGALQTRRSEEGQQDDLVRKQYAEYSQVVLVVGVLDGDHDQTISASEIAHAPVALRTLDKDQDGALSPEECGQSFGRSSREAGKLDPEFVRSAHRMFMRSQPVLAALDTDHDARISAQEIRNAAAALKTLDKNGDSKLTSEEILPDPVANQANLLMRLDINRDGRISRDETSNPYGDRFRDLLNRADQDQDGFVSEKELMTEIRRRVDLNQDGVVTWAEFLKARQERAFNRKTP